MAFKVKFDTGQTVVFDKAPSQSDIDEAYSHINTISTDSVPEQDSFLKNTTKSIVESSALPIIGGTVGGISGGPAGAALGGAAGEAFRQLGQRAIGGNAPRTSLEAATNIGIEGTAQGLGEKYIGPAIKLAGTSIKSIPGVSSTLAGASNIGKKTVGDLFQIVTKIKPEYAKILFENPKYMLPGQMARAKKVWREAAEASGIPIDDVSPEIINALKKDAREKVFDTFKMIIEGSAVNAKDAQTAKQALDIALMPAAKTERNMPLVALYSKMRNFFTEVISKESPELAAANKHYGIAKAGERFKSFFPRNLDNTPAYFRSSLLPTALTSAGVARDEPIEGALQGGLAAAILSPASIGSIIAAAGVGAKATPQIKHAVKSVISNIISEKLKSK